MNYITRRPKPNSDEDDFDWWCDQIAAQTNITIHEPEYEPEPTGLLDIHGNEICRVRDKHPMGFRVR